MKRAEHQALNAAILAYCSTPRTMADVQERFSDQSVSAGYAVHNLVKRGLMVNIKRRVGRKAGGLYQNAAMAAEEPAVQVPEHPRVPTRWDATELVRAWSGVAG